MQNTTHLNRDHRAKPISPAFWAAVFIVVALLLSGAVVMFRKSEQHGVMMEPPIAEVPDFSFTTQAGKTLTKSDLLGKIWVVDFIFTRCAGPCPIMTSHMTELAAKVAKSPNVKLVSISVDPNYDTADVLRQYAANVHADPKQWYFLTGPSEKVATFIQRGMKQPLVSEPGAMPTHSTRFMVVDQSGMIRSCYDGTDPEMEQKILIDIGNLMRHHPASAQ